MIFTRHLKINLADRYVTVKIRELRVIEVHNRKQFVTVGLTFELQWCDDGIIISGNNNSGPKVSCSIML